MSCEDVPTYVSPPFVLFMLVFLRTTLLLLKLHPENNRRVANSALGCVSYSITQNQSVIVCVVFM